jgi:hypothetical protein
MTAGSILIDVLTDEPTSTSELYDRVGYPALVRAGLVPYPAFRAELVRLSAAGLAQSGTDDDGATTWRRPAREDGENGADVEAGDGAGAGERPAG